MLRKATLWPGNKAKSFRMMPAFCRYGLAFLFLTLVVSCRKSAPEDILLPYAKKKFVPEMQGDSTIHPDTGSLSLLPFLWLESRRFKEERRLWIKKQHQASSLYLSLLSFHKNSTFTSELSFSDNRIIAGNSLFHKVVPVFLPAQEDTFPLHLFYRENSFENGQNPTVLIPYDSTMHPYLMPPDVFFETGGILAVLGEPKHVVLRDSSRFFAKADSLARWIWRDTANASIHRRNYRMFRRDSAMAAKYTKVTEKDVLPVFEPDHLIKAANLLVASMYTTPEKMALLAIENGNATAEQTLFLRNDLFRAAVFDIRQDSATALKNLSELNIPLHPFSEKKTAILMNDTENRHVATAFMQDRMQRKTGLYPCLLTPKLSPDNVWKFILYHIAQEEKAVKRSKAS